VPMKPPHLLRPGNRYARERGGRTLGDLVRAKMALVAVCRRCKHRRLLYPANLIPRFGETCPAINLREPPALQQLSRPDGQSARIGPVEDEGITAYPPEARLFPVL
jgi:hypothetical protein